MNTYQFISQLKQAGLWDGCQHLFAKATTLERYFSVYSFILTHEPERKRGYLQRVLANELFTNKFGNWNDEDLLKNAIRRMESPLAK